MKKIKYLIFISIFSSFLASTASAALESSDVEQLNSLWANSFGEGNTEALMSLYTKNAMVFPPSSEILDSRTEIKGYLDNLKKVGVTGYSISNIDMDIKGDTVYTTGIWEATRVDTNGNVIEFEGNITNILEKQANGSWRIKFQSWN